MQFEPVGTPTAMVIVAVVVADAASVTCKLKLRVVTFTVEAMVPVTVPSELSVNPFGNADPVRVATCREACLQQQKRQTSRTLRRAPLAGSGKN